MVGPILIRNRYLVISDVILTALSAILGFAIRLDIPLLWTYLPICVPFTLMAIAIKFPLYYLFGLYRRFWRYVGIHEMLLILGATTASSAILTLLVLGVFLPQGWFSAFPRSALVIDWLWSLFFIGGIRFSVRFLGEVGTLWSSSERAGSSERLCRVLIMGAGDTGAMIVREMRNNPKVEMEPVGYVDDDQTKIGMRIYGLPVLGTHESIPQLVRRFKIDLAFIAMPTASDQTVRHIQEICESVPVAFKVIPGIYELLSGTVKVSPVRDKQIEELMRREPVHVGADDAPHLGDAADSVYTRYGKRIFDLAVTVPLFVLLSPVLALVALLVRVKLGSPVLFRQQRPGLRGKPFTIYKFRTMTDARDCQGNLLPDAQRLTSFGRFLRSTSLDELPELFNVLKGDMSLVGPRPLLMQYLDRYTPEQMRRHRVKPGITGWAQINGRNALNWEQKFALDVWYADHWSLWLDIKIIPLTIWKIFKREGINQPGQATMEEFVGDDVSPANSFSTMDEGI